MCMGMEKLGHLIEVAIEDDQWEPIMLSRRGPDISHLFFADDLLLFWRANVDGAKCLRNVLAHFCFFSGHKVSNQKIQVFFLKQCKGGDGYKGLC